MQGGLQPEDKDIRELENKYAFIFDRILENILQAIFPRNIPRGIFPRAYSPGIFPGESPGEYSPEDIPRGILPGNSLPVE